MVQTADYVLRHHAEVTLGANIAGKTEDELANYLLPENGSEYTYRFGFNPEGHNTGIYVTQHRYYLRWTYGVDFES